MTLNMLVLCVMGFGVICGMSRWNRLIIPCDLAPSDGEKSVSCFDSEDAGD